MVLTPGDCPKLFDLCEFTEVSQKPVKTELLLSSFRGWEHTERLSNWPAATQFGSGGCVSLCVFVVNVCVGECMWPEVPGIATMLWYVLSFGLCHFTLNNHFFLMLNTGVSALTLTSLE